MISSKLSQSSLSESLTYYDVLDILPDASPQEVREAYVRIKSTYNRDSVVLYTLISPEEREATLKKIEEAYGILSDPDRRRLYDQNHGSFSSPENPFSGSEIPKEFQGAGDFGSLLGNTPTLNLEKSENVLPLGEKLPQAPFKNPKIAKVNPILDPVIVEAVQNETEWSGSFLKRVRESHRLSLEEMSGVTKITRNYLTAIEEENFAKLPALVYIRGFVTQIAKVLRLPYEKVANAYLARYRRARMETVR